MTIIVTLQIVNMCHSGIQELISSDLRQLLNIKGKDTQVQLNSHKKE